MHDLGRAPPIAFMPSNAYLRRLYSVYAPIYDLAVARAFAPARRQALDHLSLRRGQRVLIVGAGTGLDLTHLPGGVSVTLLDLTPAMLARARRRATQVGLDATVVEGSADALPFADASFDAVVLHFILAVVPDPAAALREAARVLVPGGRMSILDKMASDDGPLSVGRRALNVVSPWLATDVTLRLGPLLKKAGLRRRVREKVGPFGLFRAVSVQKPKPEAVEASPS